MPSSMRCATTRSTASMRSRRGRNGCNQRQYSNRNAMYRDHFRLTAAPFSITPDTAFAYSSRAQREALNTLLLAIDDGQGFIKITGEVGTGKTLACRRFLAALAAREGIETAYVPNP